MTDESNKEVIGAAIANAAAAVSAPIVAISRLLVKKGLITADELKQSLQDLQRPGFSEAAQGYYDHLVGQITRDM